MPTVRREVVRRLCAVDQVHHRCWLMLDTNNVVIGEVCAVAPKHPSSSTPPNCVELAFSVHDSWTGRGIARHLIALAADDTTARGFASISCDVLTDNRRCVGMLESLGMRFGFADGTLTGVIPASDLAHAARDANSPLAA